MTSTKLKDAETQSRQPGTEHDMKPKPEAEDSEYRASNKLEGKVALITGGDSGIGRAVAIAYAKEGANIAIAYLDEHKDAEQTATRIQELRRKCVRIAGDVGQQSFCRDVVTKTVNALGKVDILVNNAAEQYPKEDIRQITEEQLERTFRTNIFSMFFLTQACLEHMAPGSCVINTASVTAFRGNPELLDYSATKGAIVAFTRSLARSVVDKGIRVNAVSPGPIWTPLIPSTFKEEKVKSFGQQVPMNRAGEPWELAPAYVFLGCRDSSYITGQVLHLTGGEVVA